MFSFDAFPGYFCCYPGKDSSFSKQLFIERCILDHIFYLNFFLDLSLRLSALADASLFCYHELDCFPSRHAVKLALSICLFLSTHRISLFIFLR